MENKISKIGSLFNGNLMGTLWEPYGNLMGTLWEPCGNPMGHQWEMNGTSMGDEGDAKLQNCRIAKLQNCTFAHLHICKTARGYFARVAAVLLMLVTMSVGQVWGAGTYTVVGCAIDGSTIGSYTLKLNCHVEGDYPSSGTWWQNNMSNANLTFEGKKLYVYGFTDIWNGTNCMQFQLYGGSEHKGQDQAHDRWTEVYKYNTQIRDYGTEWYSILQMRDAYFYFDASDWNETALKMVIAHANYQGYYTMTKLNGTSSLYYIYDSGISWNDAMGVGVVGGTDRSGGNSQWISDVPSHAREYTGMRHIALESKSTFLMVNHGSAGEQPDMNKCINGYSELNYRQTVKRMVSVDGGDYADLTNNVATVKVSTYALTGNGTTAQRIATIADAQSTANANVALTAAATYSVSGVQDGYTFVGWYDGDTRLSTETTYTIPSVRSTNTITARFEYTTPCAAPAKPVISGTNAYLVGQTITLTATEVSADSYQWYKGEETLTGKTDRTLTISSCTEGDAGTYYYKATNSCGTTSSDGYAITVAPARKTFTTEYYLTGDFTVTDFANWKVNPSGYKFSPEGTQLEKSITIRIDPSNRNYVKEDGVTRFKITSATGNWSNAEQLTINNVDAASSNYTSAADFNNDGDTRIVVKVTQLTDITFTIWKDGFNNKKVSVNAVAVCEPSAYTLKHKTQGTVADFVATGNANEYSLTFTLNNNIINNLYVEDNCGNVYGCSTAIQPGQSITLTTDQSTFNFQSAAQDKTWKYTFNASTKQLSCDAQSEEDKVKFTVTIANAHGEYGSVSTGSVTEVANGSSITFGNTGNLMIGSTAVTATPNTANAQYTYTFTGWTSSDYTTGGTVTKNGTVTADFARTINNYGVSTTLSHVAVKAGSEDFPAQLAYGGSFSTIIAANAGYLLPSDITVTGADKTWNQETGALTISNVTGAVSVTITAEADATPYDGNLYVCGNNLKDYTDWTKNGPQFAYDNGVYHIDDIYFNHCYADGDGFKLNTTTAEYYPKFRALSSADVTTTGSYSVEYESTAANDIKFVTHAEGHYKLVVNFTSSVAGTIQALPVVPDNLAIVGPIVTSDNPWNPGKQSAMNAPTTNGNKKTFTWEKNLSVGNYAFCMCSQSSASDFYLHANQATLSASGCTLIEEEKNAAVTDDAYHNFNLRVTTAGVHRIIVTYNTDDNTVTVNAVRIQSITVQGRFTIDDGNGNLTHTGANAGDWNDNSNNIKFAYDAETGYYKLETHRTQAQLATGSQVFHFKVGSTNYGANGNDVAPGLVENKKELKNGWSNNFLFTNGDKVNIVLWIDLEHNEFWYSGEEETKYAVTVNNGDHGTVSPNGEQQIGLSGKSVTATPAAGYDFVEWQTTGGATVANPNSATTTVTATAEGTVTAIFARSSGWYLCGGNTFGGWYQNGSENVNNKAYPFNRSFRGIENFYYREATLKANTNDPLYFRVHDGENQYSGDQSNQNDYTIAGLNTKVNLATNTNKSMKYDIPNGTNGNFWFVVKTTDTKQFWIQEPATYYNVTVTQTNPHGTKTLKDKDLNVACEQYSNADTYVLTVTAAAGFVPTLTVNGDAAVWSNIAGNVYTYEGHTDGADVALNVSYCDAIVWDGVQDNYYVYIGQNLNLPTEGTGETYAWSGSDKITDNVYNCSYPHMSQPTVTATSTCNGSITADKQVNVYAYKHFIKYPMNGGTWYTYSLTRLNENIYYRQGEYGGSNINIISNTNDLGDGEPYNDMRYLNSYRYYTIAGNQSPEHESDEVNKSYKESEFNTGDLVYIIYNNASATNSFKTAQGRVDFKAVESISFSYTPEHTMTGFAQNPAQATAETAHLTGATVTKQVSTDGGANWSIWESFTPSEAGTYKFRATATGTNALGEESTIFSDVVEVVITKPTIENIAVSAYPRAGQTVTVTPTVTGLQSGTYHYCWSLLKNGEAQDVSFTRDGESNNWTFTAPEAGTYTLRLKVMPSSDCEGAAIVSKDQELTILGNSVTVNAGLQYAFWQGVKVYYNNASHDMTDMGTDRHGVHWFTAEIPAEQIGRPALFFNAVDDSPKGQSAQTSNFSVPADNTCYLIKSAFTQDYGNRQYEITTCPEGPEAIVTSADHVVAGGTYQILAKYYMIPGNVTYTYSVNNGVVSVTDGKFVASAGTYTIQVTVTGERDITATSDVFTLNCYAASVTATATPTAVNLNDTVRLSATPTNMTNPTYQWYVQFPGTTVWTTISNNVSATANYTVKQAGTYTFRVDATEDGARVESNTVTVTVTVPQKWIKYYHAEEVEHEGDDNYRHYGWEQMTYNPQDGCYWHLGYKHGAGVNICATATDECGWKSYSDNATFFTIEDGVTDDAAVYFVYNPEEDHMYLKKAVDYYRVRSNAETGVYYSNVVTLAGAETKDVSFFATNGTNSTLELEKLVGNDWTKQGESLDNSVIAANNVYTAKLSTTVLSNVKAYTGNFWVYSEAAGNSSENVDANKMQRFNNIDAAEFYNHYKCVWLDEHVAKKNTGGTVGNAINHNLAITLPKEMRNTVSVRYAYNPETNHFSRAYLAGALGGSKNSFLVVYGTNVTEDKADNPKALTAKSDDNSTSQAFEDGSDWVYTTYIRATNPATIKLAALNNDGSGNWQFLLDAGGSEAASRNIYGAIDDGEIATLRFLVTYDFKTNRVIAAWMPDGTETIDHPVTIDADLVVVRNARKENNPQLFTLLGDGQVKLIRKIITVITIDRDEIFSDANSTLRHEGYGDRLFQISLPYDVKLSEITGLENYGQKVVLQSYRGDLRALMSWQSHIETFWSNMAYNQVAKMDAHAGYYISHLWNYSDFTQVEVEKDVFKARKRIFFPSKERDEGYIIGPVNKYDPTTFAPLTCTKTGRENVDSNWRLIGLPGFFPATPSDVDPEDVTTGTNDPSTNVVTEFSTPYWVYDWNDVDNAYTVYRAKDFRFEPTKTYFVQYTGTVAWGEPVAESHDGITADRYPVEGPSSVAARSSEQTAQGGEYKLVLENSAERFVDQTYVILDAKHSEEYEAGADFEKMFTAEAALLYSEAGGHQLAANMLADTTTIVALGTSLPEADEYTIHLGQMSAGAQLPVLYDAELGIYTALTQQSYTFSGVAGKQTGRFYLIFGYKTPSVTTGVDSVQSNSKENGVEKFFYNGTLYILRDGRIFDAQGRILK